MENLLDLCNRMLNDVSYKCGKEITLNKSHVYTIATELKNRLLEEQDEIKFISYDGKYPNLCSGTLVLEKGGKQYSMKHILSSGGNCGFTNNYEKSYIEHGDWTVYEDELPDELKPYVDKITELVNENVEQGCCGGCL